MDVGNLLHLEGAFQCDWVEWSAPDIKNAPGLPAQINPRREIHQEHVFDCLVRMLEYFFISAVTAGIDDLHEDCQLGDERFGGCDADLGPGTHKECSISDPACGTAKDIGYGKGPAVMYPRLFECGQRIRGLSRLGDPDHKTVQWRVEIPEFRGKIHTCGDPAGLFKQVFKHQPGVVRRAAGHNGYRRGPADK